MLAVSHKEGFHSTIIATSVSKNDENTYMAMKMTVMMMIDDVNDDDDEDDDPTCREQQREELTPEILY